MNWIQWTVMIFLALALMYFYGAAAYYHKKYQELLKRESKK